MRIGDHRTKSKPRPAAQIIRAAGQFLLFGLVALTPWPFGSAGHEWEWVPAVGVLTLVGVWAAYIIVTNRFTYHFDAVTFCLMGLVTFTAVQLVPLPIALVRIVSPTTAEWHESLLPASPELLPGESAENVPSRSNWVRLSVAPPETEDLLVRLLGIALIYSVTRNLLASERSFRRLAWVGFGTGVLLALLGLAQHLSGAGTKIYWKFESGSAPFGPFVNRNHFAFQTSLFLGLSVGLFLWVARSEGIRTPSAYGLIAGIGLMTTALAFSQSRGGIIAAGVAAIVTACFAWYTRRPGRSLSGIGDGRVLIFSGVLITVALTSWFGWDTVIKRMATLTGPDGDNRTEAWKSCWPLVEEFPLVGVGGGALGQAEPMVRTRSDKDYRFNTMDNEYLEALIEGGVVRLSLLLGLVVVAIAAAGWAYLRTGNPLLVGCLFGFLAVAFQSAGDFGLHTASVSVAAAAILGHVIFSLHSGTSETNRNIVVTGQLATTAAVLLVIAGLVIVLADWRARRYDRLQSAAFLALQSPSPDRWSDAVRYLNAAVQIRANQASAWESLATAHLRLADNRHQVGLAAVAGPVVFAYQPTDPPMEDLDGHMSAALRAARSARDQLPLLPGPHLKLGALVDRFSQSEPAAKHLERAKRVAQYDPDVWFASGRAAAARGDWAAALEDWKESLARSPKQLPAMTFAAAGRFPPERIRGDLFNNQPELCYSATPFLYPDSTSPERRQWLLTTVEMWAAGPEPQSLAELTKWATALEELEKIADATKIWQIAIQRFPEDAMPRNRLANLLEVEERYQDALVHLEWLAEWAPKTRNITSRLEAARHAIKLKAEIDRP